MYQLKEPSKLWIKMDQNKSVNQKCQQQCLRQVLQQPQKQ